MKAYVINRFGPAEVFEAVELPVPLVGTRQLLVRVAASSINPLDYKLRRGELPGFTHSFPAILHGDVAGTVCAIGQGVTEFAVGDQIYACAGGVRGRQGALAEYMLVDTELAAHKPRNLTLAEAAVLPLVAITAWEALIDGANIIPGDRVLIQGGTGGVGHIAMQLAKALGAKVYCTVSGARKAALAMRYGADVAIDYSHASVAEYVAEYTAGEGFDVVLDTVGGTTFEQSLVAGRVGARIVSLMAVGKLDITPAWARKQSIHCVNMSWPMATGQGMKHHGFILRETAKLVEAGYIRPLIAPHSFDFGQISLAHRYAESGLAVGKVSLTSSNIVVH